MSLGRPLGLFSFLLDSEEWMETATCRVEHANPDDFILDRGQTATKGQDYCARCPHRAACLAYGKRTKSVGVWGGELLGLSNQDEVELRPLIFLTDARPVEHLVNPPKLMKYQNPLDLF